MSAFDAYRHDILHAESSKEVVSIALCAIADQEGISAHECPQLMELAANVTDSLVHGQEVC